MAGRADGHNWLRQTFIKIKPLSGNQDNLTIIKEPHFHICHEFIYKFMRTKQRTFFYEKMSTTFCFFFVRSREQIKIFMCIEVRYICKVNEIVLCDDDD